MNINTQWIRYRSALLLAVTALALLAIVYIVVGTKESLHKDGWILASALGVAFISMAFSLKLVLWKKVLTGTLTAVVPDQLLSDFKVVTDTLLVHESSVKGYTGSVKDLGSLIIKENSSMGKSISDIDEALTVFKNSLNRKDTEIDRLKKGADAEVFRRFLNRFVRVHRAIQDELNHDQNQAESKQLLSDIQALLEDALYDSGVEQFEPELGIHLSQADCVAKQPLIKATDDESLNLKIAQVNKPGFILRTPEGKMCIQEATVTIYKFNRQEIAS